MKKVFLFFIIFSGTIFMLAAQQKTITGRVVSSDDNQPLAGATVLVKGTGDAVITDVEGTYSINVREGDILVFRYAGMKSREMIVGTSSSVDVELYQDYSGLEKYVETGYGDRIKSKITGSISGIEGDRLKNSPVSGVDIALQGKAVGVFIESINGKSAAPARVRIRGISTVYASAQPLIIIDGIPLSTETISFSGASVNPLSSININDIESVEILRDAASSAIYGARGANGVVLITTRKGYNGDTKINFTVQSGFSDPSAKREFMNAEEYISYLREAAKNGDLMFDDYYNYSPGTITYCQEEVENRLKTYSGWAAVINTSGNYLRSQVDTDWQDLVFRRGKIFSSDLSAQGGNEKLKYYAGVTYNKQEGILVSNGIEKISARLNMDNTVSKLIDIGLSLYINRTAIDQVSADNDFSSPMQAVALAPVTPPRDKEGELYNYPVTTYYNALIEVENATKKITEYRSLVNAFLAFNILTGLKWKNEIGFDLYSMKENARYGEKTMEGTGRSGYGFANYGQNQNLSGRSYIRYENSFGDFNVNALLGGEFQYTSVETVYAEGEQFASDALKTLASAGWISGGSSTLTRYSFVSGFTGIYADYRGRYLFSFSGRLDGSSKFGRNRRYGLFPGVSLGWIATEENFLSGMPYLSFLKLRAGYGITGNAAIGNFWHLGLYDSGSYNNLSGLIPGQVANPDLKWESIGEFNLGIDYGFLKNRISGEVDIYRRKATDVLLEVSIPATTGFQSQIQNRGMIENKGFEFLINSVNITRPFEWKTSLNLSINKNKVLNLGTEELIDHGEERYMNVAKSGYPLGSFYGAEYAGVDYQTGDALWYVNEQDANGNIINPDALTKNFEDANFIILGHPNPDYTGALTNSFRYNNFELVVTFQGVAGNKIHLAGDKWMASNGVWFDNQLKSQLRSWKKDGDITDVPQARLIWDNGNQSRSSRYLSEGSYLKLRDIVLSYEVPTEITGKINIRNLRLFIQGRNLITFTKYEGWDPEVSADFMVNNIYSGFDFYSAPQPRSIIFGITLGL
ncbi:MAG: SusC/RagA family TonB-linked outer membrane protein [Bacteroidales bacterium]